MEVEEVDNHALHGISQGIVTEPVGRIGQSPLDGLEVQLAYLLLLRLQPHDGVLEECQMAPHAVVRLRRGQFDELLSDVDDIHPEVTALLQVPDQVAPARNNQAVARLHAELAVMTLERAVPRRAVGVTQIVGKLTVANPRQCRVPYYMLYSIHRVQIYEKSPTFPVNASDI